MFETLQILLDLDVKGLEGQLKSGLSTLHKGLSSAAMGLKGGDWNKLFTEGIQSMNWSTIINKLFTPANLIAFFSAMAATGIIAGMQAENASATASGAAGLTTTGGSGL